MLLAGIMLLDYARWPDNKTGWERMDEKVLKRLIPMHNRVFDAKRRASLPGKAEGAHRLKSIRDTLLADNSPKLTILVGHNVNIADISGLLNISGSVHERGGNPILPGNSMHLNSAKRARKAGKSALFSVRLHWNFSILHLYRSACLSISLRTREFMKRQSFQ